MRELPAPRDSQDEDFYSWSLTYDDLIASMEVEALVEVSDDDYQGDTRALLWDGGRYGLLVFGWGSCSGCDALQSAASKAEATELRDDLYKSIRWEQDAPAMARYLREKDWSGDYMRGAETRRFVEQSLALLDPDGGPYEGNAGGDD